MHNEFIPDDGEYGNFDLVFDDSVEAELASPKRLEPSDRLRASSFGDSYGGFGHRNVGHLTNQPSGREASYADDDTDTDSHRKSVHYLGSDAWTPEHDTVVVPSPLALRAAAAAAASELPGSVSDTPETLGFTTASKARIFATDTLPESEQADMLGAINASRRPAPRAVSPIAAQHKSTRSTAQQQQQQQQSDSGAGVGVVSPPLVATTPHAINVETAAVLFAAESVWLQTAAAERWRAASLLRRTHARTQQSRLGAPQQRLSQDRRNLRRSAAT